MIRDQEPIQPNIADQTSDIPEEDSSPIVLRFKVLDRKDHTIRELTDLWQREKRRADRLEVEMVAKDALIEELKDELALGPVRATLLGAKMIQEEASRKNRKRQEVANRRAIIEEQERQASFPYKFRSGTERFFNRLGLVVVRAMEIMAETPQPDSILGTMPMQTPRNTKS